MIRNTLDLQGFFQCARLMIATEQNRELAIRQLILMDEQRDLRGDAFGFFNRIRALPNADAFAIGAVTPLALEMLVRIVRDDFVGGAEDAVGAAVVLFQLHDAQRRIIRTQ